MRQELYSQILQNKKAKKSPVPVPNEERMIGRCRYSSGLVRALIEMLISLELTIRAGRETELDADRWHQKQEIDQ